MASLQPKGFADGTAGRRTDPPLPPGFGHGSIPDGPPLPEGKFVLPPRTSTYRGFDRPCMLRPTIDVDADVVVFPVQEKCVAIVAAGYMPAEMGYTVARGLGILIPRPGNYQFFNSHAATSQIYDIHDIGAFGQDPWAGMVMCGYDPLFPTRPQPLAVTSAGNLVMSALDTGWRDGKVRAAEDKLFFNELGTLAVPVAGLTAYNALSPSFGLYRAAVGTTKKILRSFTIDFLNDPGAYVEILIERDAGVRYDSGGVQGTGVPYSYVGNPPNYTWFHGTTASPIVAVAAVSAKRIFRRVWNAPLPLNLDVDMFDRPNMGATGSYCFYVWCPTAASFLVSFDIAEHA